MTIYFRPRGGLGNQLFVYAAGRALADTLGVGLVADLVHLANDKKRSYELVSLPLRIDAVINAHVEEGPTRHQRFGNLKRLSRRVISADPLIFSERGFCFDPNLLNAPDGSTIDGFFQSWKYFHSIRDSVRTEISHLVNPSNWYEETSKKLLALGSWIGVHVRRDDYLNISGMGIADSYYYSHALNLLEKLTGVTSLVVFSDDEGRAREVEAFEHRAVVNFINVPRGSKPIESLMLMSQAHHLVIANSTFSWWAAWVGENQGRYVIYPRPWVDFKSVNDRDLSYPSWVGVGRNAPEEAWSMNVLPS